MDLDHKLFFENLNQEKIAPLFEKQFLWEVLKVLKEYLYDIVSCLPSKILLKNPLPESIFLTKEGEIIPLKELEKIGEDFYLKGEKLEGAVLEAGVFIKSEKVCFERGVRVEAFSYIEGPAFFSENTQIRHGAYIRGSVYTGKNCVIGHTTEVKNSIFLKEAKAAHFAYVGDSILGSNVNLGAGTKLANLKFTKKEVNFYFKDKLIKTGLKKFGAILGDNCQTGCNAVLQPGTLLGKGCIVFAGKVVGPGFFEPFTKIK